MSKVLIATEKPFAAPAVAGIKQILTEAGFEVVLLEKYTTKAELLAAVADVEAIIIRSDIIDAEVFDAAKQLKIVVRAGAGYDNVDLESATAHGVCVMNTPGQNANAVAELVFAMLLFCVRNRFNGTSGTELKDKKLRLEDALNATRAAVEEGIVAGGGTSLISAIDKVSEYAESLDGDMRTGARIVVRALEEPVRQIAENAGFEGSVIVAKVKESKKGVGFNAATEEYVDMIEAGIVDPVKVTRSALQNASSVAGMLLTTEAGISEIKEDLPAAPAMPAGGGMGMM